MCDKKYVYNWQKLLANFIGKFVRPSHNNNSKGLATNNVSRETIRDSDYSSVSRETIIVYFLYI